MSIFTALRDRIFGHTPRNAQPASVPPSSPVRDASVRDSRPMQPAAASNGADGSSDSAAAAPASRSGRPAGRAERGCCAGRRVADRY